MNIAKVREWIADLRSGKHEQCQKKMHYGDAYCCLGRAVEVVYGNETNWQKIYSDSELFALNGDPSFVGLPPQSVLEILGISNEYSQLGLRAWKLAYLNDEGMTFAEIADVIEQHLNEYLENNPKPK